MLPALFRRWSESAGLDDDDDDDDDDEGRGVRRRRDFRVAGAFCC